ncbi:uracil-DNA glycosylase, partial [Jaminaea rosea]
SDDPLALERTTMSPSWLTSLQPHLSSSSDFKQLKDYLRSQQSSGATIYPPAHLVHSWSQLTPRIEDVKVVVLGQDPYHGPGQAMGLSFSVPRGQAVPGSLKNMYKELRDEYGPGKGKGGFDAPSHGDLSGWASQGVLMLNSSLTVRKGEAGSHAGKGWEVLTREVLKLVVERATGGGGVVFLLWGQPASKTFSAAVPSSLSSHPNIKLLRSPHPSPLSAHRGFLGNGHFKKANEWLEKEGGWGQGGGVRWAD